MKKYSDTHEWIEVNGSIGICGISTFAQKELGEIVYVELPKVGADLTKGDEAVILESTKAAADSYACVTGKVIEVNEVLKQDISLLNTSPESSGWLYKIEIKDMADLDALQDEKLYRSQTEL